MTQVSNNTEANMREARVRAQAQADLEAAIALGIARSTGDRPRRDSPEMVSAAFSASEDFDSALKDRVAHLTAMHFSDQRNPRSSSEVAGDIKASIDRLVEILGRPLAA